MAYLNTAETLNESEKCRGEMKCGETLEESVCVVKMEAKLKRTVKSAL